MATHQLYGGLDPRVVPTYGVAEAAHYLRLPVTTLRSWMLGRTYPTKRVAERRAPAVICVPPGKPRLLTFWNLAEAYVLATIRRRHGVPLQSVRKALRYVEKELGHERPLVEQDFMTDGVDLFVDHFGRLINASQPEQALMREMLTATLQRVERDTKGLVLRLFPWANDLAEPRHVEVDPTRAFGRLVVAGTGIPTEVVAERFRSGDSVDHLVEDYQLARDKVEAALRWELWRPSPDSDTKTAG
jgi:uncharacterized protein (DUF433 family)